MHQARITNFVITKSERNKFRSINVLINYFRSVCFVQLHKMSMKYYYFVADNLSNIPKYRLN